MLVRYYKRSTGPTFSQNTTAPSNFWYPFGPQVQVQEQYNKKIIFIAWSGKLTVQTVVWYNLTLCFPKAAWLITLGPWVQTFSTTQSLFLTFNFLLVLKSKSRDNKMKNFLMKFIWKPDWSNCSSKIEHTFQWLAGYFIRSMSISTFQNTMAFSDFPFPFGP